MLKALETLNYIGIGGSAYYACLPLGWRIILWPVYLVLTLLWLAAFMVVVPIFMVWSKIGYEITFTESIEAFKDGVKEGWHEYTK